MAKMADLEKGIADIHTSLSNLEKELHGYKSVINFLKWVIGILCAVVFGLVAHGIYNSIWTLSAHETKISLQGTTISELKNGLKENKGKLEENLEKVNANLQKALDKAIFKLDNLAKSHDKLRSYVTVLINRDPKGAPKIAEAIVYDGRILAVTANTITILPPEPDEPAKKFELGPECEVVINGKHAKLSDLDVGMDVEILRMGGRVTQIQAKKATLP